MDDKKERKTTAECPHSALSLSLSSKSQPTPEDFLIKAESRKGKAKETLGGG